MIPLRDRLCFFLGNGQKICVPMFALALVRLRDEVKPQPQPWDEGIDPRVVFDVQVVATIRAYAAAASPAVRRALEGGLQVATEEVSKRLPDGVSYHHAMETRAVA